MSSVCVCECVCDSPSVCCWYRKPASCSPMERAMAHSDPSLGRTETTHTQHTEKARSQLLDLHPVLLTAR